MIEILVNLVALLISLYLTGAFFIFLLGLALLCDSNREQPRTLKSVIITAALWPSVFTMNWYPD